MEKSTTWSYKELEIEEGFKPKRKHFQYFFVVSKGGDKKCHYCVWIDDDQLGRFSISKSFEEIISSQREHWTQWVRNKIDQGNFRNLVLRFGKTGQQEINPEDLDEELQPD
jgi:hypothetical protein